MKIKITLLLSVVFLLTACSDPKVDLQKEIDALMLTQTHTPETRAKLAVLQESFVNQFPTDSLSQSYLENVSFYFLNIDSTIKAKKYAQQYIDAYPTSENAIDIELIIAKAYYKEQDYLKAIDAFEQVQNKHLITVADTRLLAAAHLAVLADSTAPNADVHFFKYAALIEQTEGLQASINAYSEFSERFPSSSYTPSVWMLYSDKLERNGEIEAAKKVLQQVIDVYPKSQQASTAKVMIEKDLVGLTAEEQLERILQENSTN